MVKKYFFNEEIAQSIKEEIFDGGNNNNYY